jgi:RNA polymerase sigma-B factor
VDDHDSPGPVAATDDVHDLEAFEAFRRRPSRRLRNELVERHMGLAHHIASRYTRAGRDEDVRQVAMIGLVKAVDRFDPEHGAAFSSFAGRTIEGEIKRFFRDKSWVLRVPRSAKELHLLVRRAGDELGQSLGRTPTVPEIAAHLQIDRDDVLRGLAATAAYQVGTLMTSSDDDAGVSDRAGFMAEHEDGYERSIDRQLVEQLMDTLPEREREIVRLRFFEELSQSDIAERVGISQMHVSRLLRRSFDTMRETLTAPETSTAPDSTLGRDDG